MAQARPPASVLVVEEHVELRSALRDWLLMSFPPLRLAEARNLEEALAHAARTAPVLALIALELPGANGIETTRALRRICPACAAIVLSMHDSEALRVAALAAGAAALIAKRDIPGALYAPVHRLLARLSSDGLSVGNDTPPI